MTPRANFLMKRSNGHHPAAGISKPPAAGTVSRSDIWAFKAQPGPLLPHHVLWPCINSNNSERSPSGRRCSVVSEVGVGGEGHLLPEAEQETLAIASVMGRDEVPCRRVGVTKKSGVRLSCLPVPPRKR